MTMARFPIGNAGEGPQPPDDSNDTWHVHDDGTWGWEIHCEVCYVEPQPMNISGGGPYWNTRWLVESNKAGQTANEMKQEMYQGARDSGRDLQRAR